MQTSINILMPGSLASMVVDIPPARHLVGLFGISLDLRVIAQVADRLSEHLHAVGLRDQLLAESFTWHIVTRYSRCFERAAGRTAQLNRIQVEQLHREDFLTLHGGLIARRHRTFAHAGEHCSDRLIVHLMTNDAAPQLAATPSIEGPGPIIDPEQASLIASLCRALLPAVNALCEAAAERTDHYLRANHADIITSLRANLGRHAVPEQSAAAAMQRFFNN